MLFDNNKFTEALNHAYKDVLENIKQYGANFVPYADQILDKYYSKILSNLNIYSSTKYHKISFNR